jgi:cobalt-zinc-cadmium efflux system protein
MAHDHHHHDHLGHDHGHDHGHHHGFGHHHHHAHLTGRKLAIAFFLSFGILLVLLVGGIVSNSLALLADAGHVVTDIAALGLSWYATWQATRPANQRRTFGYHRTGILAALANAVSLILIAGWIGWEAWGRLHAPEAVQPTIMLGAAAIGLVLNLVIGLGLKDESEHNLNVRSAFLHVMGDAAASGGVILGAGLIALTGWTLVDPLLSVAIAIFIAFGAWQVVDESIAILMEGAPPDVDVEQLVADLRAIEGVREVHDLHVWSIARNMPSLSCHVLLDDAYVPQSVRVVASCNQLLASKYAIAHTTIQAEAEHCSPDSPACNTGFVQPVPHAHDHDHGPGSHDHAP